RRPAPPARTPRPPPMPPPGPAPPPASPARSAPSMVGAPIVSWDAPGQVSGGQTFDVVVRFAGGSDLKSCRSQLHYDTSVLQLVSADPGDIVPPDLAVSPRINQIAG